MVERVQVRLVGTMGTPATETWSIGLNYGGAGAESSDQALIQAWAVAIEDLLDDSTAYLTLRGEWGNNVVATSVETFGYSGPGPADAAGAAPITPAMAGSGVPGCPFQISRCISLLTGLPGASRRGRIYMPACSPDVAVTGKGPVPGGYLTEVKTLLTVIRDAWPGVNDIYLGVYSALLEQVTPVTSLRVGDVLDTQRRRRDTLPESYSSLTFP